MSAALAVVVFAFSGQLLLAPAEKCAFLAGEPLEESLANIMKVKFVGVTPTITRFDSATPKLKINKYSSTPIITMDGDKLMVSLESCDKDGDANGAQRSTPWLAMGALALGGRRAGASPVACAALGMAAWSAVATDAEEACEEAMEVEIHSPLASAADLDAAIAKATKTGQFRECPAETLSWSYQGGVYGGLEGCIGEAGLTPCEQDGFDFLPGQLALKKPYIFNSSTNTCEATGNSLSSMTLWLMWGRPSDLHALLSATGANPVVKLPLMRMTYTSYPWHDDQHGDDAVTAKEKFKDYAKYLGAFTDAQLQTFDAEITEGTEAGMAALLAAMGLWLARSTCNRDLYIFSEAPSYGFNIWRAVQLVNHWTDSFYSPCANVPDTVSMTVVGWLPGTDLPQRESHDGQMFTPDSEDASSPWLEVMTYPENPTGKQKAQQGPSSRLLCDGVYIQPQYFLDDLSNGALNLPGLPDCIGWSFSVTKVYSAAARAGHIFYRNDNEAWRGAVNDVMSRVHSVADGLFSEWNWMGQMQIFDFIMEKPVTDPSSWLGAYTDIMSQKWGHVITAFEDCPVVKLLNPRRGAYAFMQLREEFQGLDVGSSTSTFMLHSLGIKAPTYYFSFRGADPADFYGANVTVYDFVRVMLFRDVSIYEEVARRAGIVCGGGALPGKLTYEEWKTMRQAGDASSVDGARRLRALAPRLSEEELVAILAEDEEVAKEAERLERICAAKGYSQDCLQEQMGEDPTAAFRML